VVQAVASALRYAIADDRESSVGGSSMSRRRAKRVVVGYVVSHTGKRGGPWESAVSCVTAQDATRVVYTTSEEADHSAAFWRRQGHPHARALPLVRYEIDAEEELLRDAVVESAKRWARSYVIDGGDAYIVARAELESAVRALRAHREKVGE
jgi:hypothetical protein